ncbi:MAG: hypothetical protein K2X48_17770 [Chitinophagaceae bacterium]|nr:hypothetical protein [Chitinophagaceae bacterium]
MKKSIIILLISIICITVRAQSKFEKTSKLGISIPAIWNNSEATYYTLGKRNTPNGKSISYGVNLNYSKTIYNGLFAKIGVGYFKQSFGIRRPFEYTSPVSLLYSTQFYKYDNIIVLIGIGYSKRISSISIFSFNLNYNNMRSFRQKYTVYKDSDYNTFQVNTKSLNIGQIINTGFGIERNINNKFSIEAELILPIYTKWNNDEIFFKYDYSNDTQQIARNKFSLGAAITVYYHF